MHMPLKSSNDLENIEDSLLKLRKPRPPGEARCFAGNILILPLHNFPQAECWTMRPSLFQFFSKSVSISAMSSMRLSSLEKSPDFSISPQTELKYRESSVEKWKVPPVFSILDKDPMNSEQISLFASCLSLGQGSGQRI